MTNTETATQTVVPSVDIFETPNSYVVKLDIPGAEKEKITANIENNTLVILANLSWSLVNDNVDDVKQYRREFALANDVDLQSVDAKYELGVLTVTLNKKQQFLPKTITIN